MNDVHFETNSDLEFFELAEKRLLPMIQGPSRASARLTIDVSRDITLAVRKFYRLSNFVSDFGGFVAGVVMCAMLLNSMFTI